MSREGYTGSAGGEQACDSCGGSGMVEKEVPFKFDGPRSEEEIQELWG